MRLISPPRFLAVHVKRFTKTQFLWEKNPTIVNFPVKNLEVAMLPTSDHNGDNAVAAENTVKYNLVANLVHEGKHGEGTFRVNILRKVENTWYEVQVRDERRVS